MEDAKELYAEAMARDDTTIKQQEDLNRCMIATGQ
jgi:hypothetical protein